MNITQKEFELFEYYLKCLQDVINDSELSWEHKWHITFYDTLAKMLCAYGNVNIPNITATNQTEVLEFYDVCINKYKYIKNFFDKVEGLEDNVIYIKRT